MRRRQRGVSLVVAIFLIAVVASLAAFAVSVGTANHEVISQQLLADRAHAAAKAGLEWGAYRAVVQGACVNVPPYPVMNLTQSALRGFRVEVRCVGNGGVFDITAVAQHGNFGQADYASRTLVSRFN
jgi:MSHA biogenesis protein MshP